MLEFMAHLTIGRPMTGHSELHRLAVSPCEREEDPAEDRSGSSRMNCLLSLNDASVMRSCVGKESGSHGSTPEL